jgi:hypothetical protein
MMQPAVSDTTHAASSLQQQGTVSRLLAMVVAEHAMLFGME